MTATNKRKILLLGALGNLGSQLKDELESLEDFELTCWTRKDCDLSDLALVEKKVNEFEPSIVINAVAYNNVDACENDLEEQRKATELNELLPETLARACRTITAKLIHFSTNYVFAGDKKSYTETDTMTPINYYGQSKANGEKAIMTEAKNGLDYVIIRVSNLFGPKGKSKNSKPSFFAAIKQAANNSDTLNAVDDELCCFTYTKDVSAIISEMILRPNFFGIYHVVNSGEPKTWYEASNIFFDLLGKDIKILPVHGDSFQREAKRPDSAVLVSTRNDLPKIRSFEEALADYLKSYPQDFLE